MKHKWKKAGAALGMMVFISLLGACSVKSKGGDNTPPPQDKFRGKTRVQGPPVEGAWSSSCVIDHYQSRKWSIVFAGETFSRIQEVFSDQYCQTSKEKNIAAGVYIFSAIFTDGSFEISYAIDIGSGWTQFVEEKLLIESGVLYISDYRSGETAPIVRGMPMLKEQTGTPNPNPVKPTCQNYTGQYQMNDQLFRIDQKDCQKINWSYLPDYYNPEGKSITYTMDGVERNYDGQNMKASFANDLLKLEYQNSNRQIIEIWSFQKKPCNLSNPSGEEYLTRDVWIDGKASPDNCDFYAKQK